MYFWEVWAVWFVNKEEEGERRTVNCDYYFSILESFDTTLNGIIAFSASSVLWKKGVTPHTVNKKPLNGRRMPVTINSFKDILHISF